MIELILIYLLIGGIISSSIMWLASKSYYYRPTMIGWVVIMFVWPFALVKFILRLIRG